MAIGLIIQAWTDRLYFYAVTASTRLTSNRELRDWKRECAYLVFDVPLNKATINLGMGLYFLILLLSLYFAIAAAIISRNTRATGIGSSVDGVRPGR